MEIPKHLFSKVSFFCFEAKHKSSFLGKMWIFLLCWNIQVIVSVLEI